MLPTAAGVPMPFGWILVLAACSGAADPSAGSIDTATDAPATGDDPPHACLGAALTATWSGDLDPDLLAAEVVAALPHLACDTNALLGSIRCTPADDPCSFTEAEAAADAPVFLDVLAGFDPEFEDYPYAVVEPCACRAYP